MKKASEDMRFEDAAMWRDRLHLLKEMHLNMTPSSPGIVKKIWPDYPERVFEESK